MKIIIKKDLSNGGIEKNYDICDIYMINSLPPGSMHHKIFGNDIRLYIGEYIDRDIFERIEGLIRLDKGCCDCHSIISDFNVSYIKLLKDKSNDKYYRITYLKETKNNYIIETKLFNMDVINLIKTNDTNIYDN